MKDINNIKKIEKGEKGYPNLLKEITSPPSRIFYKGVLPKKDEIRIAVVGTRKAKKDGLMIAKDIAQDLARKGIVIVSGLAFGIDASAHRGALDGKGKTMAVLGTGIDKIYPAKHGDLAQEIIDNGGCILSEYGPETTVYPSNFLDRNRIISGLCVATIIVEAPSRSGSISTAGHALDQGREVFVVPGYAKDKNYTGSHRLIRDGARLVTSAEDVIKDLFHLPGFQELVKNGMKNKEKDFVSNIDKESKIIYELLKENPASAGDIIKNTKLSSDVVQKKLGILIVEGIIKENKGKYYV